MCAVTLLLIIVVTMVPFFPAEAVVIAVVFMGTEPVAIPLLPTAPDGMGTSSVLMSDGRPENHAGVSPAANSDATWLANKPGFVAASAKSEAGKAVSSTEMKDAVFVTPLGINWASTRAPAAKAAMVRELKCIVMKDELKKRNYETRERR